jgi:hypothetical protein
MAMVRGALRGLEVAPTLLLLASINVPFAFGLRRQIPGVAGAVTTAQGNTSLRVLTFEDKGDWHMSYLMYSARRNGHHVERLGQDGHIQWGAAEAQMRQKIEDVRDYITEHVDDDDVVLFVDAYDVIVVAKPDEILEVYRELQKEYPGKQVFFNGESLCYPEGPWCDAERPAGFVKDKLDQPVRYPFLNSGAFIGRASAVKKLLSVRIPEDWNGNDQLWYHNIYNGEGQSLMQIDRKNRLFLTSIWASEEELRYRIKDGRLYNDVEGTRPGILHFQGPGHWPKTKGDGARLKGPDDLKWAVRDYNFIQAFSDAAQILKDPTPTTWVYESFSKLFPKEGAFLEPFAHLNAPMRFQRCLDCRAGEKSRSELCEPLDKACENFGLAPSTVQM